MLKSSNSLEIWGTLEIGAWGPLLAQPPTLVYQLQHGSWSNVPSPPHLHNLRPCDPWTVEQTQHEISQCSIKGWSLKVSYVLIGCWLYSLPKWLPGKFVLATWTEKMSISTLSVSYLLCKELSLPTGKLPLRSRQNSWKEGHGTRTADIWLGLRKLKVHVLAWGFQLFPSTIGKFPTVAIC